MKNIEYVFWNSDWDWYGAGPLKWININPSMDK